MTGGGGRTGNVLIWGLHTLAFAVAHTPPLWLLTSDTWEHHVGQYFDLRNATASWTCVLRKHELPKVSACLDIKGTKFKMAIDVAQRPGGAYYALENPSFGFHFRANFLKHLLRRPAARLRDAVERFERKNGLDRTGYVGVHLRHLENTCIGRLRAQINAIDTLNASKIPCSNHETPCVTAELRSNYGHRPTIPLWWSLMHKWQMNPQDVCMMSDRYLDACLHEAGKAVRGLPIVLAHDRELPQRAADIARNYSTITYDGPEGNIVDMLFMLRSAYFIGNPASSMAGNVATARAIDGHGSNFGDAEAWFHIFQVHQAPVFHSNKLEVAEKYILHARDE